MRDTVRKLRTIVQEIVNAGNGSALTTWTYQDWQEFLIVADIGMDRATHQSWLRVARAKGVVICTRGFWGAPGSMYGPGPRFIDYAPRGSSDE